MSQGCYEELQGVGGWRHLRLLGIHPEFTAFSSQSKGNLCDAPFLQVLGIKNRAGHLHWALPRHHHHQTSELLPAGFFWDTKKLVPKGTPAAMLNTAAYGTLSSPCRAEPLVQALLAPHNRADQATTDHKADGTSLKERREERWNSKDWEKEWIWGERKRRGRKGARKDVSQLLQHFSGSVRGAVTVSGKNYICSLLSKLRLVN